MRAEQITDVVAEHGEGPVWVTGTRWPDGLQWVDLLAGDVLSLDAGGEVGRRHVADVVTTIRPRTGGGLAYAVERGYALDDGPGTPVRLLPELWSDRAVRMNEGGCDPGGAFYAGCMAYDTRPGAGRVYRLDPDGGAELFDDGWTVPNGLEWSADGSTAFHVDTPTGRIDAWSWSPGAGLHDRRAYASVQGPGHPDGLTVDVEGGVWVALWEGHAVHRYDAEGRLSAVVEVPVSQVTACTFGGPERDQLFITTSRTGLDDPEAGAGALFRVEPGTRGVPVRPYAG